MAAIAALLVFAGVWCGWPGINRHGLERLITSPERQTRSRRRASALVIEDGRVRGLACAGSGGLVGWAIGGLALAGVGLIVGAFVSRWVAGMEPPDATRDRERTARDLPLAIDLLAACTAAGQPLDTALGAVSRAVGGPLALRLDALLARLSLGADPVVEWGQLTTDSVLGPFGRTMLRAVQSGAPLSSGLSRLADDSRRERRTSSQARARSVGVKAAGPLAVCFLPAFMLIGVVPTIASAFSSLIL